MMTFSDIKTDLFRMIGATSTTARADIVTAVRTAIRRSGEDFLLYGDWSFGEKLTDRVYIPMAAPYETGTVTVTQDSKTITGSGTTWTRDMEGSFFQVGTNEPYEIITFTSTTSLTLAIPYQNDTASAQTYTIYKRFYDLPLNFIRPNAEDAKISTPGSSSETPVAYQSDASFVDWIQKGRPAWFGIVGNTRNKNYYDTGTMTIATSGTTSTWTVSSGTLPTDIVDREVRIHGESRAYYINARLGATTFTTYNVYVNPDDQTSTLADASTYAITPQETVQIGFSPVADQRYIFWLSYIKRMDEMLLDSDISPIVLAGYENAFLTLCRRKLAEDGRTAMRGDQVATLVAANEKAMADAWFSEQHGETLKWKATVARPDRMQQGPSWISR